MASTLLTITHDHCVYHNHLNYFKTHSQNFPFVSLRSFPALEAIFTAFLDNATFTDPVHSLNTFKLNTRTATRDRIMADSLNMNGLSLNDSQHAPQGGPPQQNGGFGERAAYIPPHMRQRTQQAPPSGGPNGFDGGPAPAPMSNGMNSSAWAPQK